MTPTYVTGGTYGSDLHHCGGGPHAVFMADCELTSKRQDVNGETSRSASERWFLPLLIWFFPLVTIALGLRTWLPPLASEHGAGIDRLLHHSTIINIRGESYRLKDRRKAGLVPARGKEGAGDAPRFLASRS